MKLSFCSSQVCIVQEENATFSSNLVKLLIIWRQLMGVPEPSPTSVDVDRPVTLQTVSLSLGSRTRS